MEPMDRRMEGERDDDDRGRRRELWVTSDSFCSHLTIKGTATGPGNGIVESSEWGKRRG